MPLHHIAKHLDSHVKRHEPNDEDRAAHAAEMEGHWRARAEREAKEKVEAEGREGATQKAAIDKGDNDSQLQCNCAVLGFG